MNASVNVERNSWRLPPDETVQVADPRSKSAQTALSFWFMSTCKSTEVLLKFPAGFRLSFIPTSVSALAREVV
ncbi:hypothetical protein ALC56_01490 [Trachymyrmex septentrionalis]|uniref:Uncharacterized protein n=1 Tax=Trachymyrmex septentrionalis TaxID=34720 RepID=A0A195FUI2_9HYME|nr:hypothetical protein ALC56_01490 [Trachymyrmex septentrionalis]